jgi:two-component system response regulator
MENKAILFVENNADDEALTLRALKKNNIRNEVIVAHDGAEALEYLFGMGKCAGRNTDFIPQVVLLDLKLPKVDGLEVLRRLHADQRTKLLPVVILTSSTEEQDRIKGYDFGREQLCPQTSRLQSIHRRRSPTRLVLADSQRGSAGQKIMMSVTLRVLIVEDSEDVCGAKDLSRAIRFLLERKHSNSSQ